jgi:hypothetical protein
VSYKSPCRACDHKHEGSHCNAVIKEKGTIKLKPYTSNLWNDDCGPITQEFEYEQEFDCRCKYYIPSENLEFLEWRYEQSK